VAEDDQQVVRSAARLRGLAAGVPSSALDLYDVQHHSPMLFRAHVHLGRVSVELEVEAHPALGSAPSQAAYSALLRAAYASLRAHAQTLRPEDGAAPGFERKLPKAVLQARPLPAPLAARWQQRGGGEVLACVMSPDSVHILTDGVGVESWHRWEEARPEEVVDAFAAHLSAPGREMCADGEFGRTEWTAEKLAAAGLLAWPTFLSAFTAGVAMLQLAPLDGTVPPLLIHLGKAWVSRRARYGDREFVADTPAAPLPAPIVRLLEGGVHWWTPTNDFPQLVRVLLPFDEANPEAWVRASDASLAIIMSSSSDAAQRLGAIHPCLGTSPSLLVGAAAIVGVDLGAVKSSAVRRRNWREAVGEGEALYAALDVAIQAAVTKRLPALEATGHPECFCFFSNTAGSS